MNLNNAIDVLVDLVSKNNYFLTLEKEELLCYFIENYSKIVENEIFKSNIDILESKQQSKNDSLLLTKILFDSKQFLGEQFINFLNSCSFNENDSRFLVNSLDNKPQEQSILNLMQQLIKNQSFNILKEYRESPQARKDIKTQISNNNISSSILNPFLMLLNDTNAPSLRMELWQKFEMYFESGWGFNDLTSNDSNSPLAVKMQNLIKEINQNKDNKLSTHSGLGGELLGILSERISELGVPILIKMEKNLVNGSNIPVAQILEDKEKYKHSFLSRSTMKSGFVDWAIPNYNNRNHLHCSIATSDETCAIENSEAFRYEYALRELCKDEKNKNGFNKMILSFYSTSTFYDEYDIDEGWGNNKNKEIGKEFLERYKVTKEQRKILNTVPFFAMSHKVSSNLKTGIYSPNQLISYNFKILGAKSAIEDKNYVIEEEYKKSINTILKVFSQDKNNDYYSDSKSLNMLNQLYNLLITSKDEFFESKKIFNLLTNDETIQSLNSILKKIPENQNNEKQVNKNDFKTLIQSLKYIQKVGYIEFKKEQNENREELLKENEKIKNLTVLSKSLIYYQNLNDEINNYENQLNSMNEIDNFLKMDKQQQKLFIQHFLIEYYANNYSDGRTNYQNIFRQNKTIKDYYYRNYPFSTPTYYNHVDMFNQWEKEKDLFLLNWKSNQISISSDNVFKMCHFYIKDINVNNFQNFKLPQESVYHSHNAKKFNDFVDLLNPSNVLQIKNQQEQTLKKIEDLKKEKIILIDTIKNMYSKEDINFVLSKLEFNENIINEFNKKDINIKI